jgi:16S rRNA (guanine527-N7)-methyltransferase
MAGSVIVDYDTADIRTALTEGLSQLGLEIESTATERVATYFTLLLERNRSVNLISPKQDLQTQIVVHLVDSLSLKLFDFWPDKLSALDFGSGGGLPAIPLSLAFPGWQYTLVESTGKKADFLAFVKESLGLDTVTIINRFLEPGLKTEKALYDLVTARAVSDLAKLASIAGPRLKKGGFFVAFKGPQGDSELAGSQAELKKRRLTLLDRRDFILPLVEARRSLLLFEKG